MVLLILLCSAYLWKYFVFLSPLWSQMARLRSHHVSPSTRRISPFLFSREMIASFFVETICEGKHLKISPNWKLICLNLEFIFLFFFICQFIITSFNFFNFSTSKFIVEEFAYRSIDLHDVQTRDLKSCSNKHVWLNLKGVKALPIPSSNCKHIGLWSEPIELIIHDLHLFRLPNGLFLIRKRSNCFDIPSEPKQPFR